MGRTQFAHGPINRIVLSFYIPPTTIDHMAEYVGVDWASNGWLAAVRTENGNWNAGMYPSIHALYHRYSDAETILVDVPIGLPTDERRLCDAAAKDRLDGHRASSVFWTPCRDAVYADSYEKAKVANDRCRGDSLSSQAWGLIPRIREVDVFLRETEGAVGTVRESHPEVCFAALGEDGGIVTSKDNEKGRARRLSILSDVDDSLRSEYDRLVQKHVWDVEQFARRIGSANRNDLVDAMALATTAWLGDETLQTLPEEPKSDECGLPMEIVYAEP